MADFNDLTTRISSWETIKKLDTDKDGKVNLAEIKKIDTDGDGELSDTEINNSGIKDPEVTKDLKEKFKAAGKTALEGKDIDGTKTTVFSVSDLSSTIAEIKAKRTEGADEGKDDLTSMSSFVPRAILNKAADADGDGKITLGELKNMDKSKFRALAKEAGREKEMMRYIDHVDDYVQKLESEGKSNNFEVVPFNSKYDYQSVWTYKDNAGTTKIRKEIDNDKYAEIEKKSSNVKIQVSSGKIDSLEKKIPTMEKKVSAIEAKTIPMYESEVASLEAKIEKLEKKEKSPLKHLDQNEKAQLKSLRETLTQTKAELESAKTESSKAKPELKTPEEKLTSLENRANSFETKIIPLYESKIASLETEISELEKKSKFLKPEKKEKLESLKEELKTTKKELEQVKSELSTVKEEITQTKTGISTERAKIAQENKDISAVDAEYAVQKANLKGKAGGSPEILAFIDKMEAKGQLTRENMLYLDKIIQANGTVQTAKVCNELSSFLDSNQGPMSGPEKLTLTHDVLHDIAFPGDIDQASKGTCAAAAVQMKLAITDPEKYAKIATTLAKDENYTMKKSVFGDDVLKPNTTYKGDSTDTRSLSCKIMQNAFMDYAKSEGSGDSATVAGKKVHYDSRLSVDGAQGLSKESARRLVADSDTDLKNLSDETLEDLGSGVFDSESESLEEALFNKDIDVETDKGDIIKEINDDLGKGKPVVLGIDGHAVLITGLDKTQNPPKYQISSWSGTFEMTEEQIKKVALSVLYDDE